MTTKLFEAYKKGDYKPSIGPYIELFQPITIKESIYDFELQDYKILDNHTRFLYINSYDIIKTEFKGDDIVYIIRDEHMFWDAEKGWSFFKDLGNRTISVNYKNIKNFNWKSW